MKYNWRKTLYIVRGLPGEGKSTLAKKLVGGNIEQVCENDNFWFIDGEYNYDPDMTHIAGWWCWGEVFKKLRTYDKVAVANTFVQKKYIIGYIEECKKLEINVIITRPKNKWKGNTVECFAKNIHNVPLPIIMRMKDQYEEMTQEEVNKMLKEN